MFDLDNYNAWVTILQKKGDTKANAMSKRTAFHKGENK